MRSTGPTAAALKQLQALERAVGLQADAQGGRRAGVMAVPRIASVDDWEACAMALQAELARSAHEDTLIDEPLVPRALDTTRDPGW